jgi:signal transduction histidine kinase
VPHKPADAGQGARFDTGTNPLFAIEQIRYRRPSSACDLVARTTEGFARPRLVASETHGMDSGRQAKVLLVDDEEDIRETTASFLADIGYAVTAAASGDEALKMVEADPSLTLLITDVEMPGKLHGFALARHAKAIRPDLRIIYITGHSDLSWLEPDAAHGPVLRKPFRLGHLADEIERALAQAKADLLTARVSEGKALRELTEMRREGSRREVDNVALRASADRAKEMTLAKSSLLTSVVHDLRQPLTVIVGTLEMITGKQDERGERMVARALTAATRLGEGIDSILDGARLAFTGMPPKVKPFPIAPILSLVRDAHEGDADRKSIALRVRETAALVVSDPVLLTSILDNLIGNAIKYTERGGVLVGCRHRRDKLVVQVWDTGIGVPSDLTGAIFEEYRRTGPEDVPGFGVGLAIVKRASEQLGHAVAVRSIVGRGSCFSVDLPLAVPA